MSYGLLGAITDDVHLKQSVSVKERYCWECHRETPHGRVNSLSAVPNAQAPLLKSPVPDWMNKLIRK